MCCPYLLFSRVLCCTDFNFNISNSCGPLLPPVMVYCCYCCFSSPTSFQCFLIARSTCTRPTNMMMSSTSVGSHQRRVTQPPLLGCVLVHRFSLWVLYRQRLLAFWGDRVTSVFTRTYLTFVPWAPNSPYPLNARYGVELRNFLRVSHAKLASSPRHLDI